MFLFWLVPEESFDSSSSFDFDPIDGATTNANHLDPDYHWGYCIIITIIVIELYIWLFWHFYINLNSYYYYYCIVIIFFLFTILNEKIINNK